MKPNKLVQLMALMIVLACGCQKKRMDDEAQCVQNLQVLHLAAKSYVLENSLTNTVTIDPLKLTPFLRANRVPVCPLSGLPYQAFAFDEGPACPNSFDHTSKFQHWKETSLPK